MFRVFTLHYREECPDITNIFSDFVRCPVSTDLSLHAGIKAVINEALHKALSMVSCLVYGEATIVSPLYRDRTPHPLTPDIDEASLWRVVAH